MPGQSRLVDPVDLPSPWPDDPAGVAIVDGDGGDGKEWMAAVMELPVSIALTLDR